MGIKVIGGTNPQTVINSFDTVQYFIDLDTGVIDRSQSFSPDDDFGVGPDAAPTTIYSTTFADNSIDYSFSPTAVVIDLNLNDAASSITGLSSFLHASFGQGGFAQGDILVDVSIVTGSAYDDVLRGSNAADYVDFIRTFDFSNYFNANFQGRFEVINNPGENILHGGFGNDLLEGRGGADVLDGGQDFDIASYESSPSGVVVRLPGLGGTDSQTAIASGGDAAGDSFVSIEGLIGSAFDDQLTGNAGNNLLAGGLGDDTLDGKGGIDRVDYSRDHFFDTGDTADAVVVRLGLNGASGTGVEFRGSVQVSTDTLISIENVTGTSGSDTIVGNEQSNTLDGRDGDDTLDGGLGNDTLIGGPGNNTASFASHNGLSGEIGTISLGLNGADGSAKYGTLLSTGVFLPLETDVLRDIQNVTGSSLAETINGNERNNVLEGRGGNDNVNGGAGDDTYVFTGSTLGSDRFFDTSGTDKILVNSFGEILGSTRDGNDLVIKLKTGVFTAVNHFAGNAIETLVDPQGRTLILATANIGGNGSGIISGGNGGETLDGRGGDDFLFGGNGSDRLIGGDGDDRLTGGNGGDTFVFGPGFGHDVITDFSQADKIEFDGGLFGSFEAVKAASQQVGNDTVITLDPSDTITLQDVALKSLRASHFSFVPAASPSPSTGAADAAPLANVALLGSYMASTFVAASDGHGSSVVADPAVLQGAQPVVAPPHA